MSLRCKTCRCRIVGFRTRCVYCGSPFCDKCADCYTCTFCDAKILRFERFHGHRPLLSNRWTNLQRHDFPQKMWQSFGWCPPECLLGHGITHEEMVEEGKESEHYFVIHEPVRRSTARIQTMHMQRFGRLVVRLEVESGLSYFSPVESALFIQCASLMQTMRELQHPIDRET